jgi:tripartite-type tricarboxylate transporter receptor subunit TctC
MLDPLVRRPARGGLRPLACGANAVTGRRLPGPSGTFHQWFCGRRAGRYGGPDHGAGAIGSSRPAIRVENRPGSGGNIAAGVAINATPDGYTVLFSGANNAISASLYKHLNFDFIRDTVPVAMFTQVPNMMVVSKAMPVKTVQEFIDYCKANPGKISFSSSGNGTTVHMAGELFKAMTKCDMVHVPYRGSALAMPDVISNKVQVIFDNLPTAMEQARGGSVRALGVSSTQRWPSVPDVPAIAETVPGYESLVFYGMSAPKGTPPEIIATLNKAINEVMKDPKLIARFADIGGVPRPMTPEEYGKFIAGETEKWRKVVEFAGVSVD